MSGTGAEFNCLSDQRLAAHALDPSPVWLWSADATRIRWGNPEAAAIFGAASPGALGAMRFDRKHPAAAQIARLAGTLPQGGAARLERLRGFDAGAGGTLNCLCSHITLGDDFAILVIAIEHAGEDLALPERARRLLADFDRPAAIFTADGEPIEIMPAARERFGKKQDLAALGAAKLAREALLNGSAEGKTAAGPATMLRLGADTNATLLLALSAPARKTTAQKAPRSAASEAAPAVLHGKPYRFVWHMDVDTRFTIGAEEFAGLLGPQTADVLNRPWAEVAKTLDLDRDGKVAAALASRDTWSSIDVLWPVDDEDERLTIEMSGLPVSDRDRRFIGYRGFGVCREVDRLAAMKARRQSRPQAAAAASEPSAALSATEHDAFQKLGYELSERLKKAAGSIKNADKKTGADTADDIGPDVIGTPPPPRNGDAVRDTEESRPILDRLPAGILVYRLNNLIYANRAFLSWTGYASLGALAEAGGLDSLFIESRSAAPGDEPKNGGKTLTINTVNGKQKPVEGRLFSTNWGGESALVLMISTQAEDHDKSVDLALRRLEAENRELKSILDTATDGVVVVDRAGRVLSANRSAQALFGYEAAQFAELMYGDLFAPESRGSALDDLERLARASGAGMLGAGREAIGLVRQGGLVPLSVSTGRLPDGENFCAVFRDITAWKRHAEELINAKQEAEKASIAKSEFLATISHEIRTPLNAIIGFSEVMMDERFGPIGNERYRQYLKDIHASGSHLISLLNDLLDLSKIEAGKLELSLVNVDLNALVQSCVAIMQPQANRERVIIRTSLHASLPPIVADARSVRQIALNLLSNSIKFTGAGGQVIVSTVMTGGHEVSLRVRDTGKGMTEKELQTALEPFRQLATSGRPDGSGLGLPISKALAQANRARFNISSQVADGTLVEVAFPAAKVLAR
jgi:PAS domain S-box-containing protein